VQACNGIALPFVQACNGIALPFVQACNGIALPFTLHPLLVSLAHRQKLLTGCVLVLKLNCGRLFKHNGQFFVIELTRTQINFACQIECKFYEKINLIAKMKEEISFPDPVLYSELLPNLKT
jgi:hypothetical protein